MDFKLIALVKMNDGVALVLDRMPVLKYKKIGSSGLLGSDGDFFDFMYIRHERMAKAFGGRKFELPMENGDPMQCSGQVWDGANQDHYQYFGCSDYKEFWKLFSSAPISTVDRLRDCYVFSSNRLFIGTFESMVASYEGKIYEYYEYERLINPERYATS